jgi:hypothetical protein
MALAVAGVALGLASAIVLSPFADARSVGNLAVCDSMDLRDLPFGVFSSYCGCNCHV